MCVSTSHLEKPGGQDSEEETPHPLQREDSLLRPEKLVLFQRAREGGAAFQVEVKVWAMVQRQESLSTAPWSSSQG